MATRDAVEACLGHAAPRAALPAARAPGGNDGVYGGGGGVGGGV